MQPLLCPGGSAGSSKSGKSRNPRNLAELVSVCERYYGYDAIHNKFFASLVNDCLVADLGCGRGYSTFYLATTANRVTGFDVDSEAIAAARELSTRFREGNVDFVQLASYSTGFPPGTFDVVVSGDVIEHVQDPLLHLKEASRVLRPGGLLLMSTPNGLVANGNRWVVRAHSRFHVMEYTPTQVETLLAATGFELGSFYEQVWLGKTESGALSRMKERASATTMGGFATILKTKMTRDTGETRVSDWDLRLSEPSRVTRKSCRAFVLTARRRS